MFEKSSLSISIANCDCLPPFAVPLFSITSGNCSTTNSGRCIQSPNFPQNYGNNQACEISVRENIVLHVSAFNTESRFDTLTINDEEYSGASGPAYRMVESGQNIKWKSDATGIDSGFVICGAFSHVPTGVPRVHLFILITRAGVQKTSMTRV